MKLFRITLLILATFLFLGIGNLYSQKGAKKSTKKTTKVGKQKEVSKDIRTNILDPDDDSMSGSLEWNVVLDDDNGNLNLPPRFRNWWYVRLDGINTKSSTRLNIIGDGFPGKSVVLPVYSYDRVNWQRLKPENIIKATGEKSLHNYTIEKQFDSATTVWLARYYPYSLNKLNSFLKTLKGNKFVKIETIGKSTQGRPIKMLTITNPKYKDKDKKRIWIHSRTHPSETGSSFAVEGLVKYLISQCCEECKGADLSKLIFNIVPMLNPDGVALGNARVTPDSSYDLERMWFRTKDNYSLLDTCPVEVKTIHKAITQAQKKGPEFIVALNIHSKNAAPDWRSFLYSNFKFGKKDYPDEADSLFKKQLSFSKLLSEYYCVDTIKVRASEGSVQSIDKKLFPEAWWWVNFQDKVLAATFETTSGYDGCFEDWVTYKDHEYLGEAIAKACNQYYKHFYSKEYFRYERPTEDVDELMMYFIGNAGKVDNSGKR